MRPFFPGREPGRPVFVAHRGASDRALENSPAAFALAVSDGADMIEFDVRLSADGVPVVFHDDRTGRTAKENLAVARTPAARLRAVRLKNGEKLPFLADVLEIVGGNVPVNIESKAPGGIAAAAKALSKAGYGGELLLSSGLRDECLAARDLLPGIPCGLVTRRPSASDLAFCLRHGLSSIHPSRRLLTVAAPPEGRGVRHPVPAVHGRRPGGGVRADRRRRRRRLLQPRPDVARSVAPALSTPFHAVRRTSPEEEGRSDGKAQPCRFIARRATNGAPPSEATQLTAPARR